MRERILAAPRRKEVYDLVQRLPGIHARRIQREMGVSMSTVQHHLRVLSSMQLLTCHVAGTRKAYFVNGHMNRSDQHWVSHLRSRSARRIVLNLLQHPGQGLADLVARVPLARSTILYHLNRLERAGLIEGEGPPRLRLYRVSEGGQLEAILDRHQDAFMLLPESAPPSESFLTGASVNFA